MAGSEIPPELQEEFAPTPPFTYLSRQLEYNSDCSIRLTPQELGAARVRVTVETLYIPSVGYKNLKFRPEKGFYGRITHHQGSSGVIKESQFQWPKQIVFDWRNEGLLTRHWSAVLAELYFPVVKTNVLSAVESDPTIGIAWAPLYSGAYNARTAELWAAQADTGIFSEFGEGGRPILPMWCFAPPEWLWKFKAEPEGVWTKWTIESWLLIQFPGIAIGTPNGDATEPDSDSGGENNEAPSESDPPDPESESPADPRSDQNDYTSAQPPVNPDPDPPDGVEVAITITKGARWRDTEGGNAEFEEPAGGGFPCGSNVYSPYQIVFEVTPDGFNQYFLKFTPPGGSEYRLLISGRYGRPRYQPVSPPQVSFVVC